MPYTLKEITEYISHHADTQCEIVGDAQVQISQIATIDNSQDGDITFLANSKYRKMLTDCKASAVIIGKSDVEYCRTNAIVMDNPYAGFAYVAQLLDTTPVQDKIIHRSSVVSETAKIGQNVSIAANAVIDDNAVIGDNVQIGAGSFVGRGTIINSGTRIWPNVTVYHGVVIGNNCAIHSNSVIGADGFGYAPHKKQEQQQWVKIPQLGGVVIGDNTEIGASTTIDRGAIDDTVVGKGVIVDNQIQIGHNVQIGDYTAIAAGTMIAGSTKIGEHVTIGGSVAIAGHLTIVDKAFITGRTLVIKDIKEAGVYSSGMPAATNKEWRNNTARYRKLTELFDRVKALETK